jgi:signal transduction histidine kinase
VKKHSGADQIEIKYESTPENVKVIIRDNGKGFVPSAVKGQHGLTVMKERAEAIGGTLDVISYPGRGTSIEIVVPVHNHRRG